jgi:hypothetical protein
MASPAGNYTYNGLPCSVVATGSTADPVCGVLQAVNERGAISRFCYDGNPTATLPEWGITGVVSAQAINFSNGTVWTRVIPAPAAVATPAAVAAAVTSPTDFFSGTTFGVSNLVLVGVAVIGLLFMSSGGRR